jgi:CysZ protein
MERLVSASLKAIGSVFAPGMFGVFVKSLFFTLFALVGFIFIVTSVTVAISGVVKDPQIATWLPLAGGFGATLFAYFLFPGIMPVIVNFFDAKIATLIEQSYYPAARPINPPFWPEFRHDLRFSLVAIGLNILVLPLYLIPVVNLFVFYALNGHLLGKEFFVMVARRHLKLEDALVLRRTNSRIIFVGGIILTILATIPLINLFAPFWGIAVMTHLYHIITHTQKVEVLPPSSY